VMNSVEVRVGESHHGGVLVSYLTHISASLDKFISESDRDCVVLRQYWLEGDEENIPSFEGIW